MMSFSEASVLSCAVFGSCAVILTFGAMFLLVGIVMINSERKYLFSGTLIAALTMFLIQGINHVSRRTFTETESVTLSGKVIGTLPYAALILLFAVIAFAEIFFLVRIAKKEKQQLTEGVIKESLDSLTDGVCFHSSDGQPLLVNKQMQIISGELFGMEILNVNTFQSRMLAAGNNPKIIRTEPAVIVRTADSRVWEFHCGELNTKMPGMHELIAFDITEQYRLNAELKKRNEQLNSVNERLRQLSNDMVTFTAEKELLDAKIDVHDNIGRSLLACRAYFMHSPEERSRKDLLFLWRYVFSVMKKEILPTGEWDMLEKTAEMLGIRIELTGILPENLKIRTAVAAAIRECLTNTANHAEGDRLYVRVWEDDKAVTAELTNTGKAPVSEIQETGGLKNLRRIAERADGIMTIESRPQFLLRLYFPKGEKGEWQKQEYWS